jgi:hypothetical protein
MSRRMEPNASQPKGMKVWMYDAVRPISFAVMLLTLPNIFSLAWSIDTGLEATDGKLLTVSIEVINSACKQMEEAGHDYSITCIWFSRDESGTTSRFQFPPWWDQIQKIRMDISKTVPNKTEYFWLKSNFDQFSHNHTLQIADSNHEIISAKYPHIAFLFLIPVDGKYDTFWIAAPYLIDTDNLQPDREHAAQILAHVVGRTPIRYLDKSSPEAKEYMRKTVDDDRNAYRLSLGQPKDSRALAEAIKRYENDDPDTLFPAARDRLPGLRLSEQKAEASAAKQDELTADEQQIAACKNQTIETRAVIANEHRVAEISGYENAARLNQAGQMIVFCQETERELYSKYRKNGGTQSFSAIH